MESISRRRGTEVRACSLMAMDKTFNKKLDGSRKFEILLKNLMQDDGYIVEDVPLEDQHNGDLYLTDELTNESFYLEVKQDTRIADTHNLYIELETKRGDKSYKGWYYYNYSKIAVVDAKPKSKNKRNGKPIITKPIYIIDWEKMKRELSLNDSKCKSITHPVDGNTNTALLVPLWYINRKGWLLKEYSYNANDWERARCEYEESKLIGE